MPSIQATVDVTFGEQTREDDGCFLSPITRARYLECDADTLVDVDS